MWNNAKSYWQGRSKRERVLLIILSVIILVVIANQLLYKLPRQYLQDQQREFMQVTRDENWVLTQEDFRQCLAQHSGEQDIDAIAKQADGIQKLNIKQDGAVSVLSIKVDNKQKLFSWIADIESHTPFKLSTFTWSPNQKLAELHLTPMACRDDA